jgi:hypothetical protein
MTWSECAEEPQIFITVESGKGGMEIIKHGGYLILAKLKTPKHAAMVKIP